MEFPVSVAYNMKEKKIGCVLMQPLFGASISGGTVSRYFPSETWDLSPDNLQLYSIKSQEEWDKMVEITLNSHKKK